MAQTAHCVRIIFIWSNRFGAAPRSGALEYRVVFILLVCYMTLAVANEQNEFAALRTFSGTNLA